MDKEYYKLQMQILKLEQMFSVLTKLSDRCVEMIGHIAQVNTSLKSQIESLHKEIEKYKPKDEDWGGGGDYAG